MAHVSNSIYPLQAKTQRLVLREWKNDSHHHEMMYLLESEPEVVRYQEWGPRSFKEASTVVTTIVVNSTKTPRSHVELAVLVLDADTQEESTFVGRVGASLDHEASPKTASLWFAFLPSAQGRGYAREAVVALIDFLKQVEVKRLEIECDPRNQGSRRLAERLGFVKIKELEKAWESKGEWVGSLEFAKDLD